MSVSREKLIDVQNLKKYFPVKKKNIFQRKQHVHAVESVTFSIHKGETLGVVGESGCGKSTLGRVLLNLYKPTGGSSLYYGSTLEDMVPKYVIKTILNADRYRIKVALAEARIRYYERKIELGGVVVQKDPRGVMQTLWEMLVRICRKTGVALKKLWQAIQWVIRKIGHAVLNGMRAVCRALEGPDGSAKTGSSGG